MVEHRRFELLTPTLPVLCATNCANAPLTKDIIAQLGTVCQQNSLNYKKKRKQLAKRRLVCYKMWAERKNLLMKIKP